MDGGGLDRLLERELVRVSWDDLERQRAELEHGAGREGARLPRCEGRCMDLLGGLRARDGSALDDAADDVRDLVALLRDRDAHELAHLVRAPDLFRVSACSVRTRMSPS